MGCQKSVLGFSAGVTAGDGAPSRAVVPLEALVVWSFVYLA